MSKYIESVTDAHFCVDVAIGSTYQFNNPCLTFRVFVDSVSARSKIAQSKRLKAKGGILYSVSVGGVCIADKLDNPVLKPFRFPNIATCRLLPTVQLFC